METPICLSQQCAAATCFSKTTATGTSSDITREAGIDGAAHSSGAFFFDYDHDGLLDLLVCNVGKYTSRPERRCRDNTSLSLMLFLGTNFSRSLRIPGPLSQPGTQPL